MALTAAIHAYVAEKVGHLEELTDRILAAHVVLIHDEKRHPEQAYCVKVHLAVPGPDLHAQAVDADLYAAIDGVLDKLSQQIRKRKAKIVDKRKASPRRSASRVKKS
jgi:putative sigma-54 modulation protein